MGQRRKGRCLTCGGSTGSPAYRTCRRCTVEIRRQETRAEVLRQIQRWVALYDVPPRAMDWDAARARALGKPDVAERFERGHWPHLSTVTGAFGTLGVAVQAAGFEPRKAGRPVSAS